MKTRQIEILLTLEKAALLSKDWLAAELYRQKRLAHRFAQRGDWQISLNPEKHKKVLAYFRNNIPLSKANWTLSHQGQIWMSLTPMELESQGYHARLAYGNVMVGWARNGSVSIQPSQ